MVSIRGSLVVGAAALEALATGVSYDACCTPEAGAACCVAATFSSGTSSKMPGRIWLAISDITTSLSVDSKRATRLMRRCGPPITSQGNHTL